MKDAGRSEAEHVAVQVANLLETLRLVVIIDGSIAGGEAVSGRIEVSVAKTGVKLAIQQNTVVTDDFKLFVNARISLQADGHKAKAEATDTGYISGESDALSVRCGNIDA